MKLIDDAMLAELESAKAMSASLKEAMDSLNAASGTSCTVQVVSPTLARELKHVASGRTPGDEIPVRMVTSVMDDLAHELKRWLFLSYGSGQPVPAKRSSELELELANDVTWRDVSDALIISLAYLQRRMEMLDADPSSS